jgi:predicted nucleotidyltransferase
MTERESLVDLSERSERETAISADTDRIRTVVDRHPVRLAVLFGSQVTGVADASSDVDFAVEFEASVDDPGETLLSLLADLSVALDRNDIDLSLVDDLDPRVGRAAFSHGVLLSGSVERANALREEFETAAERSESERSLRDRLDETLERVDRHVGRGA